MRGSILVGSAFSVGVHLVSDYVRAVPSVVRQTEPTSQQADSAIQFINGSLSTLIRRTGQGIGSTRCLVGSAYEFLEFKGSVLTGIPYYVSHVTIATTMTRERQRALWTRVRSEVNTPNLGDTLISGGSRAGRL